MKNESLIFGRTFEEIQAMQQRTHSPRLVPQSPTYKAGDRVNWKDLNLHHPSRIMVIISHIGDTVRVKFSSGVSGDLLARDVVPDEP